MKRVILILFLFTISLFANIGKISAFSGDVKIDRNTKLLNATVGFILEQKDTVKTSDNAKAQIVFEDGTVVSIGKNAILNINEFINDTSNPKNSKVNVKFAEGAFKTITGGIGKVAPDRFKLQTKSASIGIRGTIIYGDQSMIACTQGEIEIEAGGVRQILPAGTMTKIQSDGTPTNPEPIEDEDLGDIGDDIGEQNPDGGGTGDGGGTADDEMEIEPLPTEGDGQQPLLDTPSPTLDNTQNTDGISQTVNSDTTNDTFQDSVDDAANNLTLPEPFSFTGVGKRIEFQSGSLGYWDINGTVEITPTSFDSNDKTIADISISNPPIAGEILNSVTLGFNEGDDVYWGYWATEDTVNHIPLDVPWIIGIQTPVNLIPLSDSVTFQGTVIGNVFNTTNSTYTNILQNSYNVFNVTIDFGGSAGNVTGTISFQDGFNNTWQGSLTGATDVNSFGGLISVSGGNLSNGGGNFGGNIYGENEIKAIGGGFYMYGEDNLNTTFEANGVFKAGVQ